MSLRGRGAGTSGASRSRGCRLRERPRCRISGWIRSAREGRPCRGAAAVAARASLCTTPAGTTTAGNSSSCTARSTRTMWRTPPGTSSAWRAQSHPARREPHCCPSVPIRAFRCGRFTRCFAARSRPRQCLQAGTQLQAQFFARLYVGLYFEALGDRAGRWSTSRWRLRIGSPMPVGTCTQWQRYICKCGGCPRIKDDPPTTGRTGLTPLESPLTPPVIPSRMTRFPRGSWTSKVSAVCVLLVVATRARGRSSLLSI